MAWQLIPANSLVPMPWKNGGGTTRELVKVPASSTIDDFDWRISFAALATSGPFSLFPDIDRTMIVTDGKGIELTARNERVVLRSSDEPFSFPGEIPYHASLVDGPIADLNVMTRRTRYDHHVRRHKIAGTSRYQGDLRVIVALADCATCTTGLEFLTLKRLDSLLIEGTESMTVDSSHWLEVRIVRRPLTRASDGTSL